jgi:hypothetical protein
MRAMDNTIIAAVLHAAVQHDFHDFREVNNMQRQSDCSTFTSASCCCFYSSTDILQSDK